MQLTFWTMLSVSSMAVMGAAMPSTPSATTGFSAGPKETLQEKCIRQNGGKLHWTNEDGCTGCFCSETGSKTCGKKAGCTKLASPAKGSKQEKCIRNNGNVRSWTKGDGCTDCECLAKGLSCSDQACKASGTPLSHGPQPLKGRKFNCAINNGWKMQWTLADGCKVCSCMDDGAVKCNPGKECVSAKQPPKGSPQEKCIRNNGNVSSWTSGDECSTCDCFAVGGPSCFISDKCKYTSVPMA